MQFGLLVSLQLKHNHKNVDPQKVSHISEEKNI